MSHQSGYGQSDPVGRVLATRVWGEDDDTGDRIPTHTWTGLEQKTMTARNFFEENHKHQDNDPVMDIIFLFYLAKTSRRFGH